MNDEADALLRRLPSISTLLDQPAAASWLQRWPRRLVVEALRAACDHARAQIDEGGRPDTDVQSLLDRARQTLERKTRPSLRPVINATGIVLHTGLGRAPLASPAVQAILQAAGYCNLELDLASGERGRRTDHVAELLCELTGAEAGTVVNNNAAATLLVLNTLCNGREAIVSRGQLIEIGGTYRLPEVMAKSGAIMREVGTTNRTRLEDYADAINAATGLLVHVHTSNYVVEGFVETVPIEKLVALGRERNLLVYDDLGSGALIDLAELGLPHEPTAADSIRAGADVVSFSADKLLGGPQAGVIVGRANVVARLARNPLMRTYRPDKITLAALEATLRLWRDPAAAAADVPVLKMLTVPAEELARRAERLRALLADALPGEDLRVGEDLSFAGGGSLPARGLPTRVVRWRPVAWSATELQAKLRAADPPVIARLHGEALVIDVRILSETDCEVFARVARSLARATHPPSSAAEPDRPS